MRRIYWRPHKVSRLELVLIMVCAVGGLTLVEGWRRYEPTADRGAKVEAARLAVRAMDTIRAERLRRGQVIDRSVDPSGSGLVGARRTITTTNAGHLEAKQTTINPNFAGLMVQYLQELDIRRGDVVAVGASGSFPAINIAVYAALETVGARPLVVSSAAGSMYGANDPELLWIDMERVLRAHEVFSTRSLAASRGGIKDQALGMSAAGRAALDAAIARNGLRPIVAGSLEDAVEMRMGLFVEAADGAPIAAYINIGGGTASVGTSLGKRMFAPGINRARPEGPFPTDSVMKRFIEAGVPIVHLTSIERLARRAGFPTPPLSLQEPGVGPVFGRDVYDPWLAAAVFAALLGLLVLLIRTDVGARLRRSRDPLGPPPDFV